jgi:allantoinase
MVHALRSRRVITPHGERDAAVVIDGEHIAAVKPFAELSTNIPVEDLGNLALLPGLIDVHTHINEPGRTEWEGFATATRAAAAGGFTTLIDMPLNCLPETTNVGALELKREAAAAGGPNGASQCLIDYAFWGGCVDGNQHHLEPLALAGVAGFKSFLIYPGCDGFTAIDRANLERAIPHIARTGLPLLVHAELEPSINAAVAHLNATGADWREYATYLASRPDEAELDAIEMLLELCREHRFRLHIVHLSTAKALPLLATAKREGLPVSVETCPHFLHFTAETIPANPNGPTLCKSAPAIRSAANREALWQALRDGTIDLIATDHSPCPPHMKRLESTQQGEEPGRFDLAWGGIPSLSTALSVLWTECTRRELTLSQLAQWTSAAPARLAGLATQVGSIEPGKHANLVAFDADASFTLTSDMLHYRHKISPYLGETLRGLVRSTWLRGQRVFTRGASTSSDTFPTVAPGREYALSFSLDHQSLS